MANTQSFSDPVAVTRDSSAAVGLSALDLRRGLGALAQPMYGNTFGNQSGVFAGGTTGAGLSNDLQVFTDAATAMGITANGGHYQADRGAGSLYLGMAYGGSAAVHDASNPTNPRYDMVVVRTRDPGVDSNVTETAKLTIIKGDPAATPTEPVLTSGDVILARVLIRAGTTSVIATDITDRRLPVAARGGIRPRPSWDSRNGAYEGEYRDNLETNCLERWSGTVWQPVASPSAWDAFTPTLYSAAGTVNLGTTGVARGRYKLLGKLLRLNYFFKAVRPCNLGYGTLYSRLPFGWLAAGSEGSDWHGRAQLNTQDPTYLSWIGDAGVYANSNLIYPVFNKTITDNTMANYRVASQQNQSGSGVPLLSGGFPDPLVGFSMQIELEVQ